MILRFVLIIVLAILITIVCFRVMPSLIVSAYVNLNIENYQKVEMRVLNAKLVEQAGGKYGKSRYLLMHLLDPNGILYNYKSKFYRQRWDIKTQYDSKEFVRRNKTLSFYVSEYQSRDKSLSDELFSFPMIEAERVEEKSTISILLWGGSVLLMAFFLRRLVLDGARLAKNH